MRSFHFDRQLIFSSAKKKLFILVHVEIVLAHIDMQPKWSEKKRKKKKNRFLDQIVFRRLFSCDVVHVFDVSETRFKHINRARLHCMRVWQRHETKAFENDARMAFLCVSYSTFFDYILRYWNWNWMHALEMQHDENEQK